MPTIHETPAGVSCILLSSPGSWDHLEGDRQQSDSSSQEPSPQQLCLCKTLVIGVEISLTTTVSFLSFLFDHKLKALNRRMWKSCLRPLTENEHFFPCPIPRTRQLKRYQSQSSSLQLPFSFKFSMKKVKQLRSVVGLDEDTQLVMKASSPEDFRDARMLLASPKQLHHWELPQL